MAETLTIRTASSTEIVKIAVPGPQGPKGDKGDPGDVAGLPLSTLGDTLYRGASENQRLPIGTSGQILKVSAGGIPEWANESGAVSSVAGKTGVVTLDKNDVGLGNVSNTAQVTSVTGTAPIVSSGGTTPTISVTTGTTANTVAAGDDSRITGAAQKSANLSDVANTATALTNIGGVPTSRTISAGTGLTGGGDLSANRTLAVTFGSTAGSVCEGNDSRLSDPRTPTAHAASHASAGSDPLFDQDLNTTDDVTFNSVSAGSVDAPFFEASYFSAIDPDQSSSFPLIIVGDSGETNPNDGISFNTTTAVSNTRFNLGLGDAATADIGTASTEVAAGDHGHGNITSDGKLGSTAGLPVVTTTAGAVTTLALGTANQVLRVNSGATGVEFADPAASGVTGAAASASDVLGVSGANITGVDANADRIVYWNNTANNLAYGTPEDAGAAAASHTHAASDITSGTINTALLASGTANSGTFLRGDQTWAAVSGVTTGSVDNAVLRADGTGGSTSQSSDINILDATTSTQNNVAITNEHSGQTNSSLVLGVKGTGAFIVSPARPDGAATGGNARGASAICIQTGARSANTNVASGLESVAVGKNTKAANNYAIAIGSGTYATTTAVAIGFQAGNDGADSVAIGDRAYSNTRSTSVGQLASYANTTAEVVTLGYQTNSSVARGIVVGYDVTNTLRGAFATNAFRAAYWGGTTTDATANVVLNMDATATNRFTIAANTMVVADILIAANSTASGKASFWHYHVAIRRDGSNNTALVGSAEQIGTTQTVGSPSGWSVALTADDTNEALQLAVTGEASTSITWRATAFYRLV